jgi:hypothetical protein
LRETEAEKMFNRLFSSTEDGIESMKKEKHFALGHKIPVTVKSFSRQELENKQFTAKHSSILRILTKWAESLEEIFKKPE